MFVWTEIRYQLLRNRNRTILAVCIAALLICCMSLYIGNIQTGETALQDLADNIPVHVQLTSRDGSRRVGIEIDEKHFNSIMAAEIRDPIYTAAVGGTWSDDFRTESPSFMDTTISAINSLSAIPGLNNESITFAADKDLQFLNSEDAFCVLNETYAAQYNIKIGDTMTFPIYVPRYNDDNFTIRYETVGEQTLSVIGLYQPSIKTDTAPVHMIVSIPWLQKVVQTNDLTFIYDPFSCTLQNPLNLNEFKEEIHDGRFFKITSDSFDIRHGDGLLIDDQLFIETAEKLEQNLKVLRLFMIPFFSLVILMITLVIFQILRSAQRDMAIAASLGRSKLLSASVYFLSTLIADFVGGAIAFVLLLVITTLTAGQILIIIGLFLLCSIVGICAALFLLLRFDTLSLLTKVD